MEYTDSEREYAKQLFYRWFGGDLTLRCDMGGTKWVEKYSDIISAENRAEELRKIGQEQGIVTSINIDEPY